MLAGLAYGAAGRALAQQGAGRYQHRWDVRRFGAAGDGRTLNTRAVQAAIDACSASGGGSILFPAPGNFVIGTVYLKDHVTLEVEGGARITGSTEMRDYSADTGSNPYYPEPIDRCLIFARNARDIGVTGAGAIVGREGDRYVPVPGATGRDALQRPMLIRFDACERIRITGLGLRRCGAWCIHLTNSRNFALRDLEIDNEGEDGIVLESSADGAISGCRLDCGDDCVALLTNAPARPLRNITITGCRMRSRWSAVRFGPASRGNMENVVVSDCIFSDCGGGGLKLGMFEGAEIRNCIFANIIMDQVAAPILVMNATWPEIGSTDPDRKTMPPGSIHHLQFHGIRAVTPADARGPRPDRNSTIFLHGHPQAPLSDISLSGVEVTFAGGGTVADGARRNIADMDGIDYRAGGYWTDDKNVWGIPPSYGLYARHVRNLSLNEIGFSVRSRDLRPPLFCSDSARVSISRFHAECAAGAPLIAARDCVSLTISGCRPDTGGGLLLRLEGAKSKDVTIPGEDRLRPGRLFECADGAVASAVAVR